MFAFLTSSRNFDLITHFWRYDAFLTSRRTFWRHGVFFTNFLTSWRVWWVNQEDNLCRLRCSFPDAPPGAPSIFHYNHNNILYIHLYIIIYMSLDCEINFLYLVFDIMTNFWMTCFDVMTHLLTSWRVFDVIAYFLRYDVFFYVMTCFDVMMHFWRHELFYLMTHLLTSLRVFDVMSNFWHHDVFLTSFWRLFDVFLTS